MRSRTPPGRGPSAPRRLGLPLLGLVAACLVGFLSGAAAGLLAPAGLLGEEEAAEQVATGSVRVGGLGGFALSNLAGQLVSRQTILLMGRDVPYVNGRPAVDAPARSDTMMLVSVDPDRRKLGILSIPRDTRADIPGHGAEKINAALALGGPPLAMQTVSDLLGTPIDHYALVRLDGLARMVDLIGGVDMEVPANMRYTDRTAGLKIRLKKGYQHLDGQKAHEFVRFRHDSQGDIGRIARQQAFVQAVVRKVLSPQGVLAIPQLAQALQENIETDIDPSQLVAMAAWARGLGSANIRMAMLPGEFSAGMRASYWIVDPDRARRMAARFLREENPSPPPDTPENRINVHVAILNGTPRSRLASEAARLLRSEGWTVWSIGDADHREYRSTRIIADLGDDSVAAALSRSLNLTVNLEPLSADMKVPAASRDDIDYIVILGQDFIHALRVPLGQGGN
ncbi:MAG: LCP family protein [Candidatus Sericytochromatia bacterium]|nr:LCP family protein [Candidatus Tanganyikabacteria bacterium]